MPQPFEDGKARCWILGEPMEFIAAWEILGRWQRVIRLLKDAICQLLTNPFKVPAFMLKRVRAVDLRIPGPYPYWFLWSCSEIEE